MKQTKFSLPIPFKDLVESKLSCSQMVENKTLNQYSRMIVCDSLGCTAIQIKLVCVNSQIYNVSVERMMAIIIVFNSFSISVASWKYF